MDPQESYFVGQLRSLVAPTPSSAAFPSSEETASHPDWLHAFTILTNIATGPTSVLVWNCPTHGESVTFFK
jgi:hypothetical protein